MKKEGVNTKVKVISIISSLPKSTHTPDYEKPDVFINIKHDQQHNHNHNQYIAIYTVNPKSHPFVMFYLQRVSTYRWALMAPQYLSSSLYIYF